MNLTPTTAIEVRADCGSVWKVTGGALDADGQFAAGFGFVSSLPELGTAEIGNGMQKGGDDGAWWRKQDLGNHGRFGNENPPIGAQTVIWEGGDGLEYRSHVACDVSNLEQADGG